MTALGRQTDQVWWTMTQAKQTAPLEGIKVLDFSTLLPGPLASLVLADAGAQVVKVERPGGEEMRRYPPIRKGRSVTFELLNRNKQSVVVDLKNEDQFRQLAPLVENCDVIVEQFRPGVMARLGLDYASVRKRNRGVIYCSITGYGQTGPMAKVAGHDLNYIAQTGLLSLASGPPAQPVVPPVLAADIAGGSYPALVNILLALYAREKTGEGAFLDIAMTDNLFMLMSWALAQVKSGGPGPVAGGELLTGGSPRYQLYRTRDGRLLATAPLEQAFWNNFCEALNLPHALRDDSNRPKETIDYIASLIVAHDATYWQSVFENRDCCCSVVETLEQALQNPHFAKRGLFASSEEGDLSSLETLPVCLVPQFSTRLSNGLVAPEPGQHNASLLNRVWE